MSVFICRECKQHEHCIIIADTPTLALPHRCIVDGTPMAEFKFAE